LNAKAIDRQALGRALTRLANANAYELGCGPVREPTLNPARRIGITGAPGAGKSTLLGKLAICRMARGPLGILAIDPSSPKSGGAILGDRVRMDDLVGVEDLYIRSVGSRNTSDGLADNLPEMLDVMDEFGFSEVMLETVGVGQAEYAVREQVDTLVLVLLPDSGDTVQAMKAGIMEMADIFVVNKSDLSGAQKMATDIKRIAAISKHIQGDWIPPVLLASASQSASVQALSDAIDSHQAWLSASDQKKVQQEERSRYRLKRIIERRIIDVVARQSGNFFDAPLTTQLAQVLEIAKRE